jgi:hypothetical protein
MGKAGFVGYFVGVIKFAVPFGGIDPENWVFKRE